jgi:hypothetical protein
MTIKGGELALRVLGGVDFRGVLILSFCFALSFSCSCELFVALLHHFACLCRFLCLLLTFTVFLLLDDLLEFFLAFWSSSCAS